MSCFEIKNFSQFVNRVSLYEECLKEYATSLAKQRKRIFIPRATFRGARSFKRVAMGGYPI
jgi:hypothetical protein